VVDTFQAAGLIPKVDVKSFWDTSFIDDLEALGA
jgi:hypothetical protein